jgi:hypothetical protein
MFIIFYDPAKEIRSRNCPLHHPTFSNRHKSFSTFGSRSPLKNNTHPLSFLGKNTSIRVITIDSNPIENAIRQVAVGRKNYLFAGSHDSVQRAAVAYTILAACKTANINPTEYLADVFQKLPCRRTSEVDDLIPGR